MKQHPLPDSTCIRWDRPGYAVGINSTKSQWLEKHTLCKSKFLKNPLRCAYILEVLLVPQGRQLIAQIAVITVKIEDRRPLWQTERGLRLSSWLEDALAFCVSHPLPMCCRAGAGLESAVLPWAQSSWEESINGPPQRLFFPPSFLPSVTYFLSS